MITVVNEFRNGVCELRGKSTDTKPLSGIGNGSSFYAYDTQELYMFDAETKEWIKQ